MYQMRGCRVAPMRESEIASRAINTCYALGLSAQKSRKLRRFDMAFEKLFEYRIILNPMDDLDWQKATFDLTIGHCEPGELTISVPNRIYDLACKGERDSLLVIFHEIGHLLLGHKPLLHFSNSNPTQVEDAEWQADYFAEVMLGFLGYETSQLTLDLF